MKKRGPSERRRKSSGKGCQGKECPPSPSAPTTRGGSGGLCRRASGTPRRPCRGRGRLRFRRHQHLDLCLFLHLRQERLERLPLRLLPEICSDLFFHLFERLHPCGSFLSHQNQVVTIGGLDRTRHLPGRGGGRRFLESLVEFPLLNEPEIGRDASLLRCGLYYLIERHPVFGLPGHLLGLRPILEQHLPPFAPLPHLEAPLVGAVELLRRLVGESWRLLRHVAEKRLEEDRPSRHVQALANVFPAVPAAAPRLPPHKLPRDPH